MRHYILTTSGDIVVICFHTAVCLSCQFVNYVMAFSICYWANYGKTKLSRKSANAVADDRVLKFLYPQCDVIGNTGMVA